MVSDLAALSFLASVALAALSFSASVALAALSFSASVALMFVPLFFLCSRCGAAGDSGACEGTIARSSETRQIGVITGASTGCSLDGALVRADAALWRTPYQSDPDLQESVDRGSLAIPRFDPSPPNASTQSPWRYRCLFGTPWTQRSAEQRMVKVGQA